MRCGEKQSKNMRPLDLAPLIAKGLATYLQLFLTFLFGLFDSGQLLQPAPEAELSPERFHVFFWASLGFLH